MTNLQEPVVNSALELVEIDAAIFDIQTKLDTNLPWLSNSYGRSYRHKRDESGISYYFPEVYIGKQNGQYAYYRPTPDNDKKAMCFFVVGRETPYRYEDNKYNYLRWPVGIVFSVNLNLINDPLLTTELFTQQLIKDVRGVLTRGLLVSFYRIRINDIVREMNEVYAEFSLPNETSSVMAPQAIFRVNIDVILQESCPDVAYNACTILQNNISQSEILTCLLPTLNFADPNVFNALSAQQKLDIEAQL
jgi:hypothetical protein